MSLLIMSTNCVYYNCFLSSSGQDRFRGLMPQYTRRSAAAIVMCDVTRKDTLEGAKLWKQSVDKSVYLPNGQPIPCVLLINKVSA